MSLNQRYRPLVSALALTLVAASPQAPPQPPPSPVVRVTLSLVQVDAVVTDKAGHHVTDLTAADFEIFENGRQQEITHCSYVALPRQAAPAPRPQVTAGSPVPPPPPATTRLRPERVRRTLALVVDDLGLSFRSTIEVREALKKFVDQQMEPGDLVAIVRTRGGIGALQQFTTDKAQLHAAIENVRFNAGLNRMGVDWSRPGRRGQEPGRHERRPARRQGTRGQNGRRPARGDADRGDDRQHNFVISGLRELPGRKGVVVFSDGLRLYQDAPNANRSWIRARAAEAARPRGRRRREVLPVRPADRGRGGPARGLRQPLVGGALHRRHARRLDARAQRRGRRKHRPRPLRRAGGRPEDATSTPGAG